MKTGLSYKTKRKRSSKLINVQTQSTTRCTTCSSINLYEMSMRNVEIKAKIRDYENICRIAEKLSGSPPTIIKQNDIFYTVKEGRLKMRFYANDAATLIRYERAIDVGPKLSDYDLLQFSSEESTKAKLLDQMLQKCLGVKGRIVKERKLYMVGQTRIHIDTVEGLGHFMELEVVLKPEQTVEEGQTIAECLQRKLEVADQDRIDRAYVEMQEKEQN